MTEGLSPRWYAPVQARVGSLVAAGRRRAEPYVLAALERGPGARGSVGVFEYPLHPLSRYGWDRPPHAGLLQILAASEATYEKALDVLLEHVDEADGIPIRPARPGGLSWDNDFWAGLDAFAHRSFLRERRPATYLEVGSGYSTMFARRAIDDHGLPTRIVSVDPHPRADIDALCDEVIRQPLEGADLDLFSNLEAGDILVLDGTHTVFMNSDTVVAFLDIVPRVPAGVLVCIDDIFLPWDYHDSWSGRWYGEQYLLATLLLGGAEGWELRFPAWYLTQESPLKDRFDPLWSRLMPGNRRFAKSFWMERVE